MMINRLTTRVCVKQASNVSCRNLSALAFEAFGAPLKSAEDPNASVACTGNQVKVSMTSAPVTMQDLLFIKGNSLVSNCGKNLVHSKPGIAGLLGLGTVAEVGSNVQHVKASDSIIVSQTGTWTSKGIFRGARVRKAPAVSPEDTAAFCLGLTAYGMLTSGVLKKGDTIVHNIRAGPLASAVTAVATELGFKLTDKADTKGAAMVITATPGTKLGKCLGPNGTLVVCAEDESGSAVGSSQSVSVSDMIFNNISIVGFDLPAYIATADEATLSQAFAAVEGMVKDKKIGVASKVFATSDAAGAVKAATEGKNAPVFKF